MQHLLIAVVVAASAAVAADAPTFVVEYDTAGNLTVSIANQNSVAITGVLISTKQYEGTKLRAEAFYYLDTAVNRVHDRAIQPGEKRTFPFLTAEMMRRYRPEVTLQGVLLADGGAAGTANGIAVLRGRRQEILRVARQADELLAGFAAGAFSESELRNRILAMKAYTRAADPGNRLDQQVRAIGSIISDGLAARLDRATPCDAACVAGELPQIRGELGSWRGTLSLLPENTASMR